MKCDRDHGTITARRGRRYLTGVNSGSGRGWEVSGFYLLEVIPSLSPLDWTGLKAMIN